MKLVMTLLVRDEEDILDANLRYHFAAGVDFVIATDNLSADRSPEILRAYEREGRLRILEEPADNYEQSKWVTRMARLAAIDHAADWVIHNDADEFWWPESGNLKTALETVPTGSIAAGVSRSNFVPRPPSEEPFFRTMTVRERASLNAAGNPLPGKVCHRGGAKVAIGTGNHNVYRRRFVRRRRVVPAELPVTVFHFPARSYRQFRNKIEKGGAAALRNPPMWDVWPAIRRLYDLLLRGELEAYYESLVLDDDVVAAGLADGSLIRDGRLRDRLDHLYGDAA